VVVAPWLRHAALARLSVADVSQFSPLPLAVPSPISSEPLPTVLRYADATAVLFSLASPPTPHSGPGLQVLSWSYAWLIFSTLNDATPGGALAMTREGDAERQCDKRVATMPVRRGKKTSPARLNKGLRQGVKTTPLHVGLHRRAPSILLLTLLLLHAMPSDNPLHDMGQCEQTPPTSSTVPGSSLLRECEQRGP
jgi:hypothetical protein